MPDRKLVITGTGPEKNKLEKLANSSNIKFLGNVSEKELIDLYARCRAVVVAAKDEDLGLSAIEAQAAGKPTIAVKEGGLIETVNKKTGIFFYPEINSLKRAVKQSEKMKWNKKAIQQSAKRFDISVFIKNMQRIVNEEIKKGLK